jgi:hypothetical protein
VYDPSAAVALPPSGSNISKVDGRKGRSAGKFLGGVGNIGLALCRLEIMTDIVLTGEGSQYSPEQEFKISWSAPEEASSNATEAGEVKVKALVPPWLREYISSGARNLARKVGNQEGHRAKELLYQLDEEEEQRRNE